MEGTLEVIVVDDFERGVAHYDYFLVNDAGARIQLELVGELSVPEGGRRVRVTGERVSPERLRVRAESGHRIEAVDAG
jgi:hypothetical protein